MFPSIKSSLNWLDENRHLLKDILRGIERESLAVDENGILSNNDFPKNIGSPLTHSWITTDFAEPMFEFVTPTHKNIDHLLLFLGDLHKFTLENLENKSLWPISMQPLLNENKEIKIAKYGTSNSAKLKEIYRHGLSFRYGKSMQIISGVHYNFSFSESFWQNLAEKNHAEFDSLSDFISDSYFKQIRNYLRFGWLIPFLFGASPSISTDLIQDPEKRKKYLELSNGSCCLPYATSLRMSDLGYTNEAQKFLNVQFNCVEQYAKTLLQATQTPFEKYQKIGLFDENKNQKQLNENILQIDSEFYAVIRPKRVTKKDQLVSHALLENGVQYIEVRAIDVDPFSPIGVNKMQIHFLDVFLTWCALIDSPKMNEKEMHRVLNNWDRVVLEGRKPDLMLDLADHSILLNDFGKSIFDELFLIADIFDKETQSGYLDSLKMLFSYFDSPEKTPSAKMLEKIKEIGMMNFSKILSNQYKAEFLNQNYQILTKTDFLRERENSLNKLKQIEENEKNKDFQQYYQSLLQN